MTKTINGDLILTEDTTFNESIEVKGNIKGVLQLSMDQTKGVEELKKEIGSAIKKLDQGQGVLILTDLFGGTPSNIALSFLKPGKVEVVTGVNLPMLLKLSDMREGSFTCSTTPSSRDCFSSAQGRHRTPRAPGRSTAWAACFRACP